MSGMCPAVNDTSPVIYNSLRYDEQKHVVTFHLLEKDWNDIKGKSWLKIVSNDMLPLINSELVFLGDEGVVLSVSQVDPVATFGLFSVQTFDVCSSLQGCQVLEVCHVVSFTSRKM
jgi:hypothetical protein